ncbi:MAG: hypothetical protein FJ318_07890 [SAR202 cluster bacterium]|nr:hypothetical protein [SAR202 cluster bacterium]
MYRQGAARHLTLLDLIANGTLDADTAATMSAIGQARKSFLVAAMPSQGGKTTTLEAVLDCVPEGTPIHHLSGATGQLEDLTRAATGGYLVAAEFSNHMPNYLWGPTARQAFATAKAGTYAMAGTIHASEPEEAIEQLFAYCRIADTDAARFGYVITLHVGGGWPNIRRRVARVFELDTVSNGAPRGRTLHRWRREDDTFAREEQAKSLGVGGGSLAARASEFRRLAKAGRTTLADLRAVLSAS